MGISGGIVLVLIMKNNGRRLFPVVKNYGNSFDNENLSLEKHIFHVLNKLLVVL